MATPGQSVIQTERADVAAFRTAWGLPGSVAIIGGNSDNLSRNDEINLYDNTSALIDRLTFGDQDFPGTIRTQNISGNPNTLAVLGTNDVAQWSLSFAGDGFASITSTGGDIANPGTFTLVPEPATMALLGLGGVLALRRRRKA